MSKKNSSKRTILSKKLSLSFWQVGVFLLLFAGMGVYAVVKSSAARHSTLPACTIMPTNPKVGDYSIDITAPLPPVPATSIEQYYRVKLQTPYNTSTMDAIYDNATGTAKLVWKGELVKGKYAFYFINYEKYADYPANSDPVRVSQTCSVNVR